MKMMLSIIAFTIFSTSAIALGDVATQNVAGGPDEVHRIISNCKVYLEDFYFSSKVAGNYCAQAKSEDHKKCPVLILRRGFTPASSIKFCSIDPSPEKISCGIQLSGSQIFGYGETLEFCSQSPSEEKTSCAVRLAASQIFSRGDILEFCSINPSNEKTSCAKRRAAAQIYGPGSILEYCSEL